MIIEKEAEQIILRHLLTGVSFNAINTLMYNGKISRDEIDSAVNCMMSEGLIEVNQAVVKKDESFIIYKLSDAAEIHICTKDDMK